MDWMDQLIKQVTKFVGPFIIKASSLCCVLQRMEQMLSGFQSDLGSLSAEIQTLQEQSIAMNVKLKNRQAVRGELSQFVDEMAVADSMIK